MDLEEVKDFRALRARFQNNSNFNPEPVKKTVTEVPKQKNSSVATQSPPTLQMPHPDVLAPLKIVIKELHEKPSFTKETPLKSPVRSVFVGDKPVVPSKPPRVHLVAKSGSIDLTKMHAEEVSKVCSSVSSNTPFPKSYLQTESIPFNVNSHNTEVHQKDIAVEKSCFNAQKFQKASTLPSRSGAVSEWDLHTCTNKTLEEQVVKRGTSLVNVDISDLKHVIHERRIRRGESLPLSDDPPKRPPKTYTTTIQRESSESNVPAILAAAPALPPKTYAKLDNESCKSDVSHTPVTAVRKDACLSEPVDTKNSSTNLQKPILNSRLPQKKPLPPLHQLGPPPKKPDRPPKVDLRRFLLSLGQSDDFSWPPVPSSSSLQTTCCDLPSSTAAVEEEDVYLPPDNDGISNPSIYEETENILYGKKCQYDHENGYNSEPQIRFHTEDNRKSEIQEIGKAQRRLTEHFYPRPENVLLGETPIEEGNKEEGKQYMDLEKEQKAKEEKEQKCRRKFNITGLEGTLYSAEIMEDTKSGKFDLPLKKGEFVDVIRTTACPSGKWLAKDKNGNYGYVPVNAVKVDEQDIKMIGCRLSMQFQNNNDLYDDADGGSMKETTMPYFASFSSDSFADDNSEEAYEDIGNVHLSADKKNISDSVSYSASYAGNSQDGQEDAYADAESIKAVKKDKGEGNGKHKIWIKKFYKKDEHISPGKDDSGSEESFYADAVSQPKDTSTNKTADDEDDKVQKQTKEKLKKAAKEEKLFREKFEYTGEINVINKAVVESNVIQGKKEKLYLAVKPGEVLDVIDATEDHKVICRNSDGKYGFVLVEHLNFMRSEFE
ncbi:FYN-binding protein 2 isoform X2 [Protopterus annectens]|uniref:FYN-binding protein 2 isoform X2 n=1 Tax=Protopterus annectens TaxID=7888 RepID=UPI001CFB7205|nr:FYN-binding protein 2 isoform X2 [Protopterus annectens]